MKNNLLTPHLFILALIAILAACTSDENGTNDEEDADPIYRNIAGTSAIGRPGAWSNNCLGESCARAGAMGNYLIAAETAESALMWSDIPEGDGTTRRLYSRYRYDESLTSALVNINPSTHAILDIWSNYNQNTSINLCADNPICATALIASFSESIEDTITSQIDALLGDAWPAGRNPFEDIYIAEESDALDLMHDYLSFVVSSEDLTIFDNTGTELTSAPINQLVNSVSLSNIAVTNPQYVEAQQHEPEIPNENIIYLSFSINPSRPTTAPFNVTVNTSRSSSVNSGEITFEHNLTLASGFSYDFEGDIVSTVIEEGGNHIWVATATDSTGFTKSMGYVIQALSAEDDTPQFGGEGSCVTPAPLTPNVQNLCEEVQNGSSLGDCDTISSPSITLVESPAPCASEVQNDGDLLGVCTIETSEVRIFHYENPVRLNLIETFEEKQARIGNQCSVNFLGEWSTTP